MKICPPNQYYDKNQNKCVSGWWGGWGGSDSSEIPGWSHGKEGDKTPFGARPGAGYMQTQKPGEIKWAGAGAMGQRYGFMGELGDSLKRTVIENPDVIIVFGLGIGTALFLTYYFQKKGLLKKYSGD